MKHSFKNSLMTILILTSLIISAMGASPVMAADLTVVSVDNLQPAWDAVGAGGVWSSYDAPPDYIFVSPGKTALYDGKEAGIIKAGLTVDPSDEGIFGFKTTLMIDDLAAGTLSYDVENEEGTNPVWMTIEIDTGVVDDRADNTTYQFVPPANPAGWNTFDAAAGDWQKWNDNNGDTTGNPLIPLSQVASENAGLNVVRVYLRLGMGPSYQGSGSGTVAWVDQVIIGTVTYDFVVDQTAPVVSVPTDMTEEATDASGAVVTFDVTAEDAVDGSLTPSCIPASGATFPIGETTVNCTATDAAGNEGNASFKIRVSVPAGQYDDAHALWTYSTGWTTKTGITGPVDGTFHMTKIKNSIATFKFQGPASFVFTYRTGKNRGTFNILVDGVRVATVNAYSATIVWQKTFTSKIYNDSQVHTVMIKNTSLTGAYLDVDAIDIVAAPTPATAGVYDDADPLWVFSSGWTAKTGATGPVDDTFHLTNIINSTATFLFQGPAQFKLSYRASKNRGTFNILVDGVRIAKVNAYSATTVWQKVYTSPIYNDGKVHTVVIRNTSPDGTYIDIDAIEIVSVTP